MGARERIRLDDDWLASFCQRNKILKLSLFGSVLRDDFDDESDVDVLVDFEPDARIGLFAIVGMEHELAEHLGRKVDLRTPNELSKYFRLIVVDEAEPAYVR